MSADTRPSFRITGIRKIAAAAAVSAAIVAGCGNADASKPTPSIRPSQTPIVSMKPEASLAATASSDQSGPVEKPLDPLSLLVTIAPIGGFFSILSVDSSHMRK